MASKKELVNFRIKPTINAKLDKIAETKDVTKSELIRDIIENYVNLM